MQITPPKIIKKLFPELIWSMEQHRNENVYLTFDDGPTPDTTPWILEILSNFNAKATFFCLGKNVEQHPELFKMIVDAGHAVGNHSYSHLKGWGIRTGIYIEDIDLADSYIKSNLFRPPYGRIKPRQIRRVSERYKLIMWNVLSRDYSSMISPRTCLRNVTKNVKPGSIIVFHDSKKAFRNLKYALPRTLQFIDSKNLKCNKIEF